jgi:hypothetical protein
LESDMLHLFVLQLEVVRKSCDLDILGSSV